MQQQLKLVIGCDLAAYDFKTEIVTHMEKNGYKLHDVGCFSSQEGLYAPVAKSVADLVASGEYDYGILICGTGQGMAMAANKVRGIRASLCYDIFSAVMSKEHNNANILCTGAWMLDIPLAIRMIEAWLFATYKNNHNEGLGLLAKYEDERVK